MKFDITFDGAVLVTITTVFLYCCGFAHYNGYLSAFNIEPEMLGINFQSILFGGYIKSFQTVVYVLIAIAAYFALLSFLQAFPILEWIRKKITIKTNKLSLPLAIPTSVLERHDEIDRKAYSLLALIVLYMGCLLFFAHLEKTAKQSANKEFSTLKNAVFIQLADQTILRFISCGDAQCAGRDETTKEIYFFEAKDMKILP